MVDAANEKLPPTWPLRVALSLVLVAEIWLVVRLTAELDAGNIPLLLNAVGLLVFSVLTWRGVPWSRWLLVAFVVWRVVEIGISMALHFGPGDHRLVGTLIFAGFYVAIGVLIASPLGRLRKRAAA